MATPTWNQIAAPNFSAGNDLIAQAMNQLSKATTGFKSIADQYKDTIQKRNLGLIQEYVNSAKTPEELQSEAFKTGLDNRIKAMGGEYDTLAKAQLVDKAYDSLLSRKANQVSIASNEFGLAQAQLNAKIRENAAKLFALRHDQLAYKAEEQRQAQEGTLDINAAQSIPLNALNLDNATIDNRVKRESADSIIASALLDPKVKQTNIDTAYGNLAVAQKNAETNRLQVEAAAARAEAERKAKQNEKNPALTLLSGIDKIDADYKSDLLKPSGDPKVADSLETWWEGKNSYVRSNTDLDNIKTILSTDPKTAKLPGKMKVAIADIAYTTIMNENTLGRNVFNTGSAREQAEKAVKSAFDTVETQKNEYLYSQKIPLYRDAVRQQMIQTGSRDPVQAALAVGMNEYEMYRTNIRTPLQNMAESVYESSGSTLPKEQFVDKFIYRSVNKEPVDDLIKPKQKATSVPAQSSSSVLNTLGTGSYEDKVALLRSELEKTRDPIQSAFLNNELKKLEKGVPSPVSDPSQEPSALVAQEQRLQDQAKQRLINAGVTINTNKSKAIDKAATAEAKEVKQSVFIDTPLKVLANAVKPVPSPLIPVESQNAYKVKENNLALDFRTGKSTPTKDPVPMPKVTWKEPVQAVTINPIYAQLPQHKAVVTYVPDGDTFKATSKDYKTAGLSNISCRIDSVEAPETAKPQYGKKGQPYGEEAAKILQQMVLNNEVSIRVTKPTELVNGEWTNYHRDVCQVEVSGKDVSVELIRAGAAWLYREFNRYGQGGFDLENKARADKTGLWNLPNPVYPSDFRHNNYQNP